MWIYNTWLLHEQSTIWSTLDIVLLLSVIDSKQGLELAKQRDTVGVHQSVRLSFGNTFLSDQYLLNTLKDFHLTLVKSLMFEPLILCLLHNWKNFY